MFNHTHQTASTEFVQANGINSDGPNIINETRQYILDFDRLIDKTSTTAELYDAMLSLYPDRLNRGALWGSARAIKG